jgi:hypothetical protein
MKRFLQAFAIAAITLLSVNKVSAQNAHLMAPLTATDNGLTATICYDIAGLGNVSETQLTLSYSAVVTTECTNYGGNVAPGQTKVNKVTETFKVPVSNGRATGCVDTKSVFPAGKCPNGNWTGSVTDVTFSNITVTVAKKTFTVN